jgi:hypothetical protein
MAYFADLDTATQIARGSHVRAVGWLSAKHSYRTGAAPAGFVDRLRSFCAGWGDSVEALQWPVAGGPHTCELCDEFRASGNLGVPAGAILFVAPQMVAHYVEQHGYLPPQEFVDAVLAAPAPGTAEYAQAVAPFVARSGSTFRVKETFDLGARGMLMAIGEIVDGVVRIGDRVLGLGFELRVDAIEMITRSDRTCDVALGFRYADEATLTRLQQCTTGAPVLRIE